MPEERKTVAILFADIVGSTTAVMAHDPEVVRGALARTFDAAQSVLEAHGGVVEKFIGDAIMAVFGIPSTHDDDAERAVRAALTLHERIGDVSSHGPIPFQLRIGVDIGDAVTGTGPERQFLVTGAVVNLAARLQAAAQPGEVIVGDATRRATDGSVRYGERREVEAKGIGRVGAWPVVGLTSVVPEQHRGLSGLRAPLIGRDAEMAELRGAFDAVAANGKPRMVTVIAPPGVGKSRLVREFMSTLSADQVRLGRCLPYGEAIAFYPLQQIVLADAGITTTDTKGAAAEKLRGRIARLFGDEHETAGMAARLSVVAALATPEEALPGVTEGLAKELSWAFRRYLERRAVDRALVLVIEDVHWADKALLDVLDELVRLSGAALLLVCLARPEIEDIRPGWSAREAAQAVHLAPLSDEDTGRLIAELLRIEDLPAQLHAEVVERADGNPLFVEEFLRLLIDSGIVYERDGHWRAVPGASDVQVPGSLLGLIRVRLDATPAAVKGLLLRAAVIGRVFEVEAVGAISGEEPGTYELRVAVERDLVSPTDEAGAGVRAFRFKHALVRDVAYGMTAKSERMWLHDNYARWLEDSRRGTPSGTDETIAHHAEQAFVYAKELSSDRSEPLGSRAMDRLLTALDAARSRGQLHAVWKIAERASGVADAFECDPFRRMRAVAQAYLQSLHFVPPSPRLAEHRARAFELAEAAAPSAELVSLLRQRWAGEWRTKHPDRAKATLEREVAVAHATGNPRLVMRALIDQAQMALNVDDPEARRQYLEAAAEYGREGRDDFLFQVHMQQHLDACFAVELTRAEAIRAEWQERLPADPSIIEKMYFGAISGHQAIDELDLDVALTHLVDAARYSRELGGGSDVMSRLGRVHFERGELAAARAVLEEIPVEHAGRFLPEMQATLGRIAVRQGDLTTAHRHLARGEAACIDGDVEQWSLLQLARAEIAVAEGDLVAAEHAYREAIAAVEHRRLQREPVTRTRRDYARFLLSRGRNDEARLQLERVRPMLSDPRAHRRLAEIDALLARC